MKVHRSQLKTGMMFQSITTKFGITITGIIRKGRNGVYLCQNGYANTPKSPDLHGYSHSYYIKFDENGFANMGGKGNFRGFKLLESKSIERKKVEELESKISELKANIISLSLEKDKLEDGLLPNIFQGFIIEYKGDKVIVGCGKYKVTITDLEGFVKVSEVLQYFAKVYGAPADFDKVSLTTARRILKNYKQKK